MIDSYMDWCLELPNRQLMKRKVSRDFGVLFLISLHRYEPPDRAGSGLFFIVMMFSYLNF
jgi:hypothetical protein